ncbi:unnamed protein product [Victoria cruziana]
MVGWLREHRPVLSMVAVQVFIAGMLLLSKVVLDNGMFVFAFLTYRHLVAAAFVSPFAYFLESKESRKLTPVAMFWIFACGAFGMEKVGLGSGAGKAKVAGTMVCVGGATMITSYLEKYYEALKKEECYQSSLHLYFPTKGSSFRLSPPLSRDRYRRIGSSIQEANWTAGSLMLAGSSLSDALWYLSQVKLLKVYPAKYSATALTCWAGTLQSFVVGFSMKRDSSAWKLGLDLRLITIIYSGILTSGATFCLITWCISRRGPIYVTMFSPLVLVLVSISESLFLGERLYVGSMLGSVFIIGGLYAFLWGKSKESTLEATSQKNDDQHSSEATNSEPLGGSISSRSETALNVNEEAREEHKNGEALGSNGDGEVL